MKSIKEKAKEYGLQYPVIHYDADGNPYDDVENPSTDFEEGANYVLDEIEKIFSRANKYKDGSDHTILYLDIEFLIKQLKK